jgi:hypothetical protein
VTAADVAAGLSRAYLNLVERPARTWTASRARSATTSPRAVGSFERDLLVAESSDWRPADVRARGRGYIRAVTRASRSVYRRIHVGTTPVTLTARRGTIPITVANDSGERVTVVLRLTSPKVDLPAASDPFVLEPRRPHDPAAPGRHPGHRDLPDPGRRAHPRRRADDRRR